MRRPVRLGLIAAIILVLGIGGYSWFWNVAATRVRDGAAQWAAAARAQGIDASWQTLSVGGYPFSLRVELTGARFASAAPNVAGTLTAPSLTATVGAANLHAATLTAPEGLSLSGEKLASLKAGNAVGTVAAGAEGGAVVWLQLTGVAASAAALPGDPATAKTAQLWLELPAARPRPTPTAISRSHSIWPGCRCRWRRRRSGRRSTTPRSGWP